MLDEYIGECIVSMFKINNGIKERAHGYQNCSTSQILIFGGYVKVRVALFGSIPFITILILGQFYLGMKVVAWYVGLNGIENTDTVK